MTARRVIAGLLTVLGGGAALISAGMVAAVHWPWRWVPTASDTWAMLTSFTDLAVLTEAVALAALGLAWVLRHSVFRLVVLGLVVITAVVQLVGLGPDFLRNPAPADRPSLRVFELNMHIGGADAASVLAAARGADVVVLTELNAGSVDRLDRLGWAHEFPHRSSGTLEVDGGEGTTVFSRFPVSDTRPLAAGMRHQNWVTTVSTPQLGRIHVVAVHPVRPHRGAASWLREQQLVRSRLPVAGPTIVAGDFNAVDTHFALRSLHTYGLRSSDDLAGAGWQPTYPANTAVPPLIGIDHILMSSELTATSSETVRVLATDHLGLTASIQLR